MKNRIVILSLAAVMCTWLCAVSSAPGYSSYYVYNVYGGTYADANKSSTYSGDDYMCWAASASNILLWTGWANVSGQSFSTASAIFTYFQSYWTNNGGNVYYAWDWWFDGTNDSPHSPNWSQVKTSGGGGFWTTYTFSDYYLQLTTSTSTANALSAIKYLFDNDYGVSLGLVTASGAHAITCWGYQYDDTGTIVGLYVTDSDDGYDGLKLYSVALTGDKWYLQSFYGSNSWYISEVDGLKGYAAVPGPATVLLLASGLTGLFGLRRRLGS
jgi:hypothetical protein